MHKMIFRTLVLKTAEKKKIQKKHKIFEGKIIRKILITTLEPFGYSEIDTSKKSKNWAESYGNRLHIKTN